MRTVLRVLLLPLILLSAIVIVNIVALNAAFASPTRIKDTLRTSGFYDQLTSAIEGKIKQIATENGEDMQQIQIPSTVVQTVAESFIDQTNDYVTGKSTVPPQLSVEEMITTAAGTNIQLLKELKGMQQELTQSLQSTNISELSKEEQELASSLKNVSQGTSGTISFGKEVHWIKQAKAFLAILLPLSIGAFIIELVLIMLLSPTAPNRMSWLSATCLLLTVTFGLGIMVQGVPQLLINATASNSDSPLVRSLLAGILLPISDVLFRYHIAAVIISVSFCVIFFLARMMLFHATPAPVPAKPSPASKKTKK